MKPRFWLIAIVTLMSVSLLAPRASARSPTTVSSNECPLDPVLNAVVDTRAESVSALARHLEDLGYSPEVALQVAEVRPDLARRILAVAQESPKRAQPESLYRGFAGKFTTYDPAYKSYPKEGIWDPATRSTRETGDQWIYFADLPYALGAAVLQLRSDRLNPLNHLMLSDFEMLARGEVHATLFEAQIPRFLLNSTSTGKTALRASEVPDFMPLVRRVGLVDWRVKSDIAGQEAKIFWYPAKKVPAEGRVAAGEVPPSLGRVVVSRNQKRGTLESKLRDDGKLSVRLDGSRKSRLYSPDQLTWE